MRRQAQLADKGHLLRKLEVTRCPLVCYKAANTCSPKAFPAKVAVSVQRMVLSGACKPDFGTLYGCQTRILRQTKCFAFIASVVIIGFDNHFIPNNGSWLNATS